MRATRAFALFRLTALVASFGGSLLNPTVELEYGTFKGRSDPAKGTKSFLGMPYSKPGRLENPRLLTKADKLQGVQDATKYGPACPQQELVASPLEQGNKKIGQLLGLVEAIAFPNITHQQEDCLNLNVQVPEGVTEISKLPVLVWIHGGGFELGSSAALGLEDTAIPGTSYQGSNLVKRSVDMGQPIVFVSANYRLNFFGTLASQEITDAGVSNLCLKDQRVALRWVQKYISKFGGDPEKVTVYGESAGAMSISTQMVLDGGHVGGLFRAAWIASGPPPKMHDYRHAQPIFDRLMDAIGCGSAKDKIACTRNTSYNQIYSAIQGETNFFSYTSTLVPWYPRPDGKFLTDSPANLAAQGKVAKIPFVIGNMVDEGTLFSLVTQINVTTENDLIKYFKTIFFQDVPLSMIKKWASYYPTDPAAGSPFGTGNLNQLGPMYKRLAAMIGDYTFVAGRRTFLDVTSPKQPTWSYQIRDSIPLLGQSGLLNKAQVADLPILGSFHVSDVALYAFGTIPPTVSKNSLHIMSSLVSFCNNLNPNSNVTGVPHWPNYDTSSRTQLQFREDGPRLFKDDYRVEAMDFINRNRETFRI